MAIEKKSSDFSDSYISIILGFLVVLVGAILIYNFFRHSNNPTSSTSIPTLIANNKLTPTEAQFIPTRVPTSNITPTVTPRPTITTVPTVVPTSKSTPTRVPTSKPTVAPTNNPTSSPTPTQKPTSAPIATSTPKATNTPIPTTKPTIMPTKATAPTSIPTVAAPLKNGEKIHTVAHGETLWSISEKYYGTGYNWTLIAKANKIDHPGMIFKDNKLVIPQAPKVEPTAQVSKGEITPQAVSTVKSYTVLKGDTLWDISVKVYGDGYKWTKIAEANHLLHPRVIHPGNTLSIP